MNSYDRYMPPPCPNCKKEFGAVLGKTVWGHNICCCSDKCGEEISKKLTKNRNSKAFIDARKVLDEAKNVEAILQQSADQRSIQIEEQTK